MDEVTASVRVRLRAPATGDERTLSEVVVAVEDVSRADAPSRQVGRTVLRDVTLPVEGLDVEVEVAVPLGPDPTRRFVVRARAGADAGARTFAPYDLVSTVATPVVLDGTDDVEVTLRPVG